MFNFLIDTCVWIDLAKNPKQQYLIQLLEELVEDGYINLIVPDIILLELARNKKRIIKDNSSLVIGQFNIVKDALLSHGDPKRMPVVMKELDEVKYRIPQLTDAVLPAYNSIEKLLAKTEKIKTTDEILAKAAKRAIHGIAPFHTGKNNMNDAILLECYISAIKLEKNRHQRFAFITHNKKDFSLSNGDEKLPHQQIASNFTKIKSLYFIKITDAIKRIKPQYIPASMVDCETSFEARGLTEILKAESELTDLIWYDRHQQRVNKIAEGKIKIVVRGTSKDYQHTIVKDIWKGALLSAKKLEKKYKNQNLGPWTKFEWGMINGKLSAIRWILGEDWDELYT